MGFLHLLAFSILIHGKTFPSPSSVPRFRFAMATTDPFIFALLQSVKQPQHPEV